MTSSKLDLERSQILPTVRIGGVDVTRLTRDEWVEVIIARCREARSEGRQPAFFSSANGNVLSLYARSREFRKALDGVDGIDADGMPLVNASRWLTATPIPERCVTTDFFHDVARVAEIQNMSFYLLGGREDVNREASEVVQRKYPGLRIVGRNNGYFSRDDEPRVISDINAASPDVLWVGLGVPIEQEFVARNRHRLTGVGVIKTCGGLYDYIAGRVQRAPMWMQRRSLEWLFRTWQEPGRLMRRYATTNLHAAWLILTRTGDVAPVELARMPSALTPRSPDLSRD